jgi:hypothetical protein
MVYVPALWFSLVASIVLTVVLNLVLFLFPDVARRISDRLARLGEDSGHARVIFPWRAMLIGSLILTIVINLFFVIRH